MIVVSPPIHFTALDEQTFDSAAQILKASVSYMDMPMAKTAAMIARFMELKSTLRFFSRPAAIRACNIKKKRPPVEEILADLRKYCGPDEESAINQLLNILRIRKFYENFQKTENNLYGGVSNPMNIEQLFKNLPPDISKQANPEMLKNFDINKFNQMMSMMKTMTKDMPESSEQNNSKQSVAADNPPKVDLSDFNPEQLMSMLTPQQKEMFEKIKSNMNL